MSPAWYLSTIPLCAPGLDGLAGVVQAWSVPSLREVPIVAS